MDNQDIVILQIDKNNDVDFVKDFDMYIEIIKHFKSFDDADQWLGNNAEGGYTYRMINLNE